MPSQPEEASSRPSASLANDIAVEWKQKLITLLDDESKQELISREKKDRREFQQIAALASKMGLYSHVYAKVVVISKVPLPNYRPDLDDRRPLREVSIPISMLRRVDAYLEEYQTQKSRMKETFPDLSFARSTNNDSIGVDERLFEKPQLPALNKAALEKILRQRSLQMRDQQQAWQRTLQLVFLILVVVQVMGVLQLVSLAYADMCRDVVSHIFMVLVLSLDIEDESAEGRRMLEFRRSLPAYKEKEAILSTILRNQVVIISGQTGCGKTTQLPQFILECEIESLQGAACNIICTQPRRISAISVSERVALERGEKLGESVRFF
ncbi:hypothetical protein Ahy_B07g086708 isoform B [Arachis hypogaea]|uniref:RNA helicase n=1 Tax=Arachis hypogaea TaxID=3818 RepID=A0A444YAG6_ARAHY|nr:hypothetical protein Ahy_B07g086708 isoform B [Arachis hypogaea]